MKRGWPREFGIRTSFKRSMSCLKIELFVVMEYIHSESVSHLMRLAREQEVEIPYGIAVTIIADALQGLHAAHETKDERGGSLELVHRDVSSQNILVGTDGLSRVLDFGITKFIGSLHISQIGRVKGKFAYIAPEQIANTDVQASRRLQHERRVVGNAYRSPLVSR